MFFYSLSSSISKKPTSGKIWETAVPPPPPPQAPGFYGPEVTLKMLQGALNLAKVKPLFNKGRKTNTYQRRI